MKSLFKLSNLKPENIFCVPEGYFDTFSERLLTRIADKTFSVGKVNNELPLADYSVLNELDKQSGFSIPKDYFESLPARLMLRINAGVDFRKLDFSALEDAFSSETDEHIFRVPDGYFDTLSDKIMNRVMNAGKQDEEDFSALDESSELGILASLPKANIFKTPDNYFTELTETITKETGKPEIENQQAVIQTETRTVRLMPNWLRYGASVAAIVVLAVSSIFFYYRNDAVATEPCTDRLLCDVSDAELMQYFEENKLHDEVLMEIEKTQNQQVQQPEETSKSIDFTEDELLEEIDM